MDLSSDETSKESTIMPVGTSRRSQRTIWVSGNNVTVVFVESLIQQIQCAHPTRIAPHKHFGVRVIFETPEDARAFKETAKIVCGDVKIEHDWEKHSAKHLQARRGGRRLQEH